MNSPAQMQSDGSIIHFYSMGSCRSKRVVASVEQDLLEGEDEEEDDAPLDDDWGLQDSTEPGPPV